MHQGCDWFTRSRAARYRVSSRSWVIGPREGQERRMSPRESAGAGRVPLLMVEQVLNVSADGEVG